MKQRIHRNQSLYDLSKMSFEVLQVAMKRWRGARTNLLEEANFTMKLMRPARQAPLEVHDIIDVERPPMATIASYQARRNARSILPPLEVLRTVADVRAFRAARPTQGRARSTMGALHAGTNRSSSARRVKTISRRLDIRESTQFGPVRTSRLIAR